MAATALVGGTAAIVTASAVTAGVWLLRTPYLTPVWAVVVITAGVVAVLSVAVLETACGALAAERTALFAVLNKHLPVAIQGNARPMRCSLSRKRTQPLYLRGQNF